METFNRKYLNIDEIQKEYLPISKKKIRCFVKKYLNIKLIGGRIYVERNALERILADPEREKFSLT
ncbi:MAG: helix-turn-helix domain-containing protein [Ruminococcaceae bacterium]|nr:helix-turn-helix domain-containing protein [Oscillospiraceae bacterium]